MRTASTVLGILASSFALATSAASQTIPTPESVLGFTVGQDFKLARYEESIVYFERLAAASDHVKLINVGETSLGRPWTLALISTPENLANIERYREIAQRLAHPAGLSDEEAHRLAREGKAFVDISGGLHASEVAGAQHTIQLAYDLVVHANEPHVRAVLDDVVLLLWPSLNPDGQDIVVDWYRENVGGPYETAPLHELYQKYIGHDNNRDAYMLNVPESRVIGRTWRDWEPQIIYVHHQTAPFPTRIWLPPFAEPIAPRVPAVMSREVNAIGMLIAQGLEQNGQPGATHMGTGFDAWYPGYIDYLPMLQNIAAFWTETALYRYATPYFYTLSDFPQNMRDLRPQTLYPSPWTGGWWRLRDAVDYMNTASRSVLEYAAKYKENLLYNRYQAGRDAIHRYENEPPYAYFIPQHQHDPTAAVEMLRRLAFNGIRVSQLTRAVEHEGQRYAAGTWVIPMNQEFAELARQLLDVQEYPDLREFPDGPPEQPYDAAGWTLPYQMGVRVISASAPLSNELRSALTPLRVEVGTTAMAPDAPFSSSALAAGIVPPAGGVTGSGAQLSIDPAATNGFRLVNRARNAGGTVRYDPTNGRYIVAGIAANQVASWAEELSVSGTRTSATGDAPVGAILGLYKPWRASMDEGWTRWLFDQYEFPYATLTNADIRGGSLRNRYDVIVLTSESPNGILSGFAKGSVPPRYEGGIGEEGVRALDAFVREGGTLVCLNRSADFAIEQLRLPVQNVVGSLRRSEFFASGSILEVTVDPTHPIMAGMPDRASVFFDGSPVFTTTEGFEGRALAKYADHGSPLLSGYLLGESHLEGFAAGLDVRHGNGHVVLIGFRPQWRGQPLGTFRVLFNAALYGEGVARGAAGPSDFWGPPNP